MILMKEESDSLRRILHAPYSALIISVIFGDIG